MGTPESRPGYHRNRLQPTPPALALRCLCAPQHAYGHQVVCGCDRREVAPWPGDGQPRHTPDLRKSACRINSLSTSIRTTMDSQTLHSSAMKFFSGLNESDPSMAELHQIPRPDGRLWMLIDGLLEPFNGSAQHDYGNAIVHQVAQVLQDQVHSVSQRVMYDPIDGFA